ncbi:HAD-like domain-containing protein [Zopfochytrium polystomum]|nr:HAD-like domain-containing protein [Zopfochytrium polystomum]
MQNCQRTLWSTCKFARAIALCHDAIPSVDERSHKMIYEAQSPDETALLYSVVNSGMTLTFHAKSTLRLTNADNQTETYEILNTLEFNSDRKRMSVIVRHPDTGKIALFCKGADNIIMARLSTDQSKNPAERLTKTDTALREFSETGLRTLMVAFRELTEDEYETFAEEYDAAENALADRETKVAEVAEKIERDLVLLGCTAIEDRLQDLVPESIEYLLRCGIRLWVLTGDKKETAINIGMSSRIIRQGMAVLVLAVPNPTVESLTARVNQLITELAERTGVTREPILSPTEAPDTRTTQPADACLVVTGENLAVILGNLALEPAFLRLGVRCHSVICCRVTPLQKALVVKMVKDGLHAMTLAIGDGANDVSMIQGADVGVGIKGREGNQAVRSADYAMGEFRFLTRLVAVHGRYSYMRLAGLIFYSLYKNFTFITVQWWFGFYSSWSRQTVYEDIFFISFNVVFTSLPPLFFAMFEKDVDEDKIEEHPELYMQVRDGSYWNWTVHSDNAAEPYVALHR